MLIWLPPDSNGGGDKKGDYISFCLNYDNTSQNGFKAPDFAMSVSVSDFRFLPCGFPLLRLEDPITW